MLQAQSSWNPLLEKTHFPPAYVPNSKEKGDFSMFCMENNIQPGKDMEEFYDAYTRKRDAKLRAKWSERAKRAAEMKDMLDDLVVDWIELKPNFTGYPNDLKEYMRDQQELHTKFKYICENRKVLHSRSASFSTKDSSSSSSSSSSYSSPSSRSANTFVPRSNSKIYDPRTTISNQSFASSNSKSNNSNSLKEEKAGNPQSQRSARRSISFGGSKDFTPVSTKRYSALNSSGIEEKEELQNSKFSRTRKKWGRIEQPGILAESRKETHAKGFKRLLGFAW